MEGSLPKEDDHMHVGNDLGASPSHKGDNDEDEVAEQDPEGRYYRYSEVVGRGRFKRIFKAFDTQIGIDVAWSKLSAEPHHLSDKQLQAIANEMTTGLDLDHPNIIKCFKCWKDTDAHCINLITELFTSGNLRQYRNLHKHLDLKAVKRMARQILKGLDYLHSMQPPVVHGDLRCDKIYVNGHSGEIKIGDLGLATLIPLRWEESDQEPPPNMQQKLKDPRVDVFAFGLCMLELLTLKQLDPQHYSDYRDLVTEVQDGDAARFISSCLADWENRPGAAQLLEDPFLQVKKTPPADSSKEGQPPENIDADDRDAEGSIAIGKLRGEDYNFEFHGKVKDGKMHFRLHMTQVSDGSDSGQQPIVRTIDFVFDPEVDTADNLAAEISEEFNLSPTDTEICAAALREWLAKEMPGAEERK